MKTKTILTSLGLALGLFVFTSVRAVTPEEARAIAKDAYIYGFLEHAFMKVHCDNFANPDLEGLSAGQE